MQRFPIILAAVLSALAGCHTRGTFIDENKARDFQDTITTASELEDALGVPTVVIPRGDGKSEWIYEGLHTRLGATAYIPVFNYLIGTYDKHCTRLSVVVDPDSGQLSDWDFSSLKDTDHWLNSRTRCEEARKAAD